MDNNHNISLNNEYVTLTKEYIADKKRQGESAISNLIQERISNNADVIFILENIGHIPSSYNMNWLVPLLESKNEDIRYWTVKNLGKTDSDTYINYLFNIANNDSSTLVRREAVSSIGRKRNNAYIPFLQQILKDKDPKIVCQAIRGLLVFKGRPDVDESLKELINNENEIVRTVIYKEFFDKEKRSESKLAHSETYSFLKNVVVNGDVRDVLKFVPEESIHLTFTSPPYYNARDYSIYPSYDAYLKFLEEVFIEIYRVTKEGRFLVVNTSPIIVPRISRAHSSKRYPIPFDLHHYLTQMGWDFIDDIVWEKPAYSVKNRIGGFQQHRKPLAYKPNSVTEYLMVYRKHTNKLIDWNIHQYNAQIVEDSKVEDGFETTNVWKICPKSDKVHSAIFPIDLCRKVIEYYSFKGDLVFDPFGGSGTLGRTAKSLNRLFFMTEKESKYFEYMKSFQPKDSLFENAATKFLTLKQFKNSIL